MFDSPSVHPLIEVMFVRRHPIFFRLRAFALLPALLAAAPAFAQPRSADAGPGVVDRPKIGIDNFGRVNEGYYRGAQPRGRDFADLASLGVRTVIDLTSDD